MQLNLTGGINAIVRGELCQLRFIVGSNPALVGDNTNKGGNEDGVKIERLIISVFHSVPGVPRKKMERFGDFAVLYCRGC